MKMNKDMMDQVAETLKAGADAAMDVAENAAEAAADAVMDAADEMGEAAKTMIQKMD